MKEALILLIAILFFSFPMTLKAEPSKQEMTKAKVVKPLAAMKSTMQSPSKAIAGSTKGEKAIEESLEEIGGMTEKAEEKSTDAAKTLIDEKVRVGAEKNMDQHK